MIGRYFIVLVIFCVPRVYGHATMEQRLLELEHVVKLQGDALLQQRENLEQQREELVFFKIENELLKSHVKKIDNQVNELIENQEEIIDNTKTTTDAEMQLQSNGTLDDKDQTTDPTDPDWSPRHRTLNKRSSLRATTETDVAFYAYISGTPCLHDLGTIGFNTEITVPGTVTTRRMAFTLYQ